ncbi:hypothetical protein VNO78_35274 [Psophocarpus tetragonolobus]|uniref:Uncharacterized protein n=1 Tax=Psophocarpus tetragonolobus TaxID=3891 RepID=A0AAN9NS81_PSOTE
MDLVADGSDDGCVLNPVSERRYHGQVADTQEKTQRQQKQRHDRDGTDHKFQVGDLLEGRGECVQTRTARHPVFNVDQLRLKEPSILDEAAEPEVELEIDDLIPDRQPVLTEDRPKESPKKREKALSTELSLGEGRATGSLEGKEVWAGERSDFRIRINLLIKEFSRLSAPLAFVPVPWWSP